MSEAKSPAAIRDTIIALTADATRRRLVPGEATGRRDFGSLGVDSVNVFEIILQLEKIYSLTLNDTFLFNHRTPAEAAEALHAMLSEKGPTDSMGS